MRGCVEKTMPRNETPANGPAGAAPTRGGRARYAEGDCFAVPLRDSGFGVVAVARKRRRGGYFFGYFFGPRRDHVPTMEELGKLEPDAATYLKFCDNSPLEEQRWPRIGPLPGWDRTRWPIPPLSQLNPLSSPPWAKLIFSDDGLEYRSVPATKEEYLQLPSYGIDFEGAAVNDLTWLINNPGKRLTPLLPGPPPKHVVPELKAAAARTAEALGTLGNDDAFDWVADAQDTGLAAVHGAFEVVEAVPAPSRIGETASAQAVAAAELVALTRGAGPAHVPDEARSWVARHGDSVSTNDISRALMAVEVVEERSEVLDRWAGSEKLSRWLRQLDDLKRRLESLR